MSKKRIYFAPAAAALVICLVVVVAAQTSAISDARIRETGVRPDITGTWLVNLSLNGEDAAASQSAQPTSGTGRQAPFIAVETFHADGTFIETSLTDYLPPQGPPGQGVWERTGRREFALTIYGVTVGDVTNPQFQGTYKVRSKLTLDRSGDEFSGPFVIEIFDPAGNQVATLEGTAQGRRARVEPLP